MNAKDAAATRNTLPGAPAYARERLREGGVVVHHLAAIAVTPTEDCPHHEHTCGKQQVDYYVVTVEQDGDQARRADEDKPYARDARVRLRGRPNIGHRHALGRGASGPPAALVLQGREPAVGERVDYLGHDTDHKYPDAPAEHARPGPRSYRSCRRTAKCRSHEHDSARELQVTVAGKKRLYLHVFPRLARESDADDNVLLEARAVPERPPYEEWSPAAGEP